MAAIQAALDDLNRRIEEEHRREPTVIYEHDGNTMPYLRMEAARDLPFSCFGPPLRVMANSGFPDVRLRPAGEQVPDSNANFAFPAPEEFHAPARDYPGIVRLATGGRMSWNGAAVDMEGLRRHVRALGDQSLDAVVVAPSSDTDFRTVYEALRLIEQEKIGEANRMPVLSGCAGSVGPVREGTPVC